MKLQTKYEHIFKHSMPLDKNQQTAIAAQVYNEIYKFYGHPHISVGTVRIIRALTKNFLKENEHEN